MDRSRHFSWRESNDGGSWTDTKVSVDDSRSSISNRGAGKNTIRRGRTEVNRALSKLGSCRKRPRERVCKAIALYVLRPFLYLRRVSSVWRQVTRGAQSGDVVGRVVGHRTSNTL